MDSVYLGSLSYETNRAIREFWESQGFDIDAKQTYWEFSDLCSLWFRLKYAPDDEELFPKGKWATLQRIEEFIEQAVENDRASGPTSDVQGKS